MATRLVLTGVTGAVRASVSAGLGLSVPPALFAPAVDGLSYRPGSLARTACLRLSSSPAPRVCDEGGLPFNGIPDLRRAVGKDDGVPPGTGKPLERGVEGGLRAILGAVR